MKVFKINGCEWVAAESEEQAKTYYGKQTGITREEIDEDYEGEASLEVKMWVAVDDLPIEEQKMAQEMRNFHGELFVLRPFSWVIKHENITEPCIICSTEY